MQISQGVHEQEHSAKIAVIPTIIFTIKQRANTMTFFLPGVL